MANDIVISNITPDIAVDYLKGRMEIVRRLRTQIFIKGKDYGEIAGAKPTLLQAGAEKLMDALQLWCDFEQIEAIVDHANSYIMYRYRAVIRERGTNTPIASSIGSCNSYESKYRWRWVQEHQLGNRQYEEIKPNFVSELAFVIDGGLNSGTWQTTGKYGKPMSYWQQFIDAHQNGTLNPIMRQTNKGQSKAYEVASVLYRVINPDMFDQMNTIDKMAQKRAMVSAVKAAANASEYFTVDIEDLQEFNPAPELQVATETKVKIVAVKKEASVDGTPFLLCMDENGEIYECSTRKPFTEAGYDTGAWATSVEKIDLSPTAVATIRDGAVVSVVKNEG